VITSEEAGVEKPDIKIYELAMERMGCDPENSVMIGNNFQDDILGAIDAGMSAIYLTPGQTELEKEIIKERGIDLDIVSDIGDIRKIL
jgi:putative hydrolase of the HAD superfamily